MGINDMYLYYARVLNKWYQPLYLEIRDSSERLLFTITEERSYGLNLFMYLKLRATFPVSITISDIAYEKVAKINRGFNLFGGKYIMEYQGETYLFKRCFSLFAYSFIIINQNSDVVGRFVGKVFRTNQIFNNEEEIIAKFEWNKNIFILPSKAVIEIYSKDWLMLTIASLSIDALIRQFR